MSEAHCGHDADQPAGLMPGGVTGEAQQYRQKDEADHEGDQARRAW